MFLIGTTPAFLYTFFRHLRPYFQIQQWNHFWKLVTAIALSEGQKTVAGLHTLLIQAPWPQRLVDFLTRSPWKPDAVLKRAALYLLRTLGWKPDLPLEIVLDASKTHKRGKRMQACMRFRGVTLPWEIRLYRPEAYCKHRWRGQWKRYFRTFNQLAAEILEALPPMFTHEKATTVLFDSAFLNRVVLRACRKQNLRFLSVAKSNRIFFPAHGKGRPSKGKPSNQRMPKISKLTPKEAYHIWQYLMPAGDLSRNLQ